jgi:DNA (cytosine-5)-methyltransferase 1
MVYYNEHDPKAAAWLRELMAWDLIAWGEVDERSIADVQASELVGYSQCHFFAGIGGWSYALRLAGWPDDRPVWTGSCPCQPFSQAGQRKGAQDERHLWPQFARLIAECKPAIVFGEQVAGPDGLAWLDAVRADLERYGYAVGAADLCAASLGAPHIRQRLYWVADAASERWRQGGEIGRGRLPRSDAQTDEGLRPLHGGATSRGSDAPREQLAGLCDAGGLGDADGDRSATRSAAPAPVGHGRTAIAASWDDCEWLYCADGFYRPVKPGTFPLAHGVPARVGRLRGYGNAIVPQVAAEFIRACF